MTDKPTQTDAELQSIIDDADAGPPTDNEWLCLECGRWTPWRHEEAHDHADGCKAPAIYAARRDWKARLNDYMAKWGIPAGRATAAPAQPAAQQPGAAGLIGALEDAQRAINSMKVEAETAAQGDEQMMLEACETISNEGLQADMAIRAALASHGQAPAQEAPAAVVGASEAVAYLDIGAGGYLDLGTDLTDEALSRLPKGRHALVIAGTYGIDGYIAAPIIQPAPQHQARPVTPYTCPKCSALWLHWPAEQSGFGMDTLNCRSTTHCDYCEKGGVEQLQRLERVPAVLAAPQPSPAAQGDAARLDWLEADEGQHVFHLGGSWYTRSGYGMPYRKRASLRAAIDAARAAQEGKSHGH